VNLTRIPKEDHIPTEQVATIKKGWSCIKSMSVIFHMQSLPSTTYVMFDGAVVRFAGVRGQWPQWLPRKAMMNFKKSHYFIEFNVIWLNDLKFAQFRSAQIFFIYLRHSFSAHFAARSGHTFRSAHLRHWLPSTNVGKLLQELQWFTCSFNFSWPHARYS
jgi:hypothetical protein